MSDKPTSSTALPMHDDTISDEAIRAAFQKAGLRVTQQRMALIALLREQGGFLDAEEVYHLAQLRGEKLSLATVYRALALFKELELVEGRIVGSEQAREEYRFRAGTERYTLTCKRCGAIVPVEPDIVDEFRREVTVQLGVTVLTAHSCFIGYCADCTAALAESETTDDESSAPGHAP